MAKDIINVSALNGVGFWEYEIVPIDTFEMLDESLSPEDDKFYIDCINLSDKEVKAKLFVAVYDGTKLKKISEFKDVTISPGKSEVESGDISFINEGETYKVFIWYSKDSVIPLCKSKVFTK